MSEYTTPQRLKDFRVMNGYTQEQAAKMTGLSPAAISHFETGKRMPSAANLRKLAIGYDVSVDYILGTREFERCHPAGTNRDECSKCGDGLGPGPYPSGCEHCGGSGMVNGKRCGNCTPIRAVLKVREFVDWNEAPDWARFWAMDPGGKANWFAGEPIAGIKAKQWIGGGNWTPAPDFGFIGDWRKSLRSAPDAG